MEKFNKLLKKLQPIPEKSDYVTDPYDYSAMNEDVSQASKQLSPEDIEKIHFIESTGGIGLQNPQSTAKGNYQIIDSTRKLAENLAKEQDYDENEPNPLRKDANLMKALVKKYENVLENSEKGPYEPNLHNIYLMHKYGPQGALNALNNPEDELSMKRLADIKKQLAKNPEYKKKQELPAKNLMDLLKE